MKAITVKQPWASLIVEGIKDIENRTWKCPEKYIGQRVLIHAAATPWGNLKNDSCFSHILTREQYSELLKIGLENFGNSKDQICWMDKYPFGAILGSVEIVDCVINHPSIWAERSYFNITSNPLPFNEEDEPDYIIYNWVLANPIKFDKPIPCKGKLSFWEFEGEIPE